MAATAATSARWSAPGTRRPAMCACTSTKAFRAVLLATACWGARQMGTGTVKGARSRSRWGPGRGEQVCGAAVHAGGGRARLPTAATTRLPTAATGPPNCFRLVLTLGKLVVLPTRALQQLCRDLGVLGPGWHALQVVQLAHAFQQRLRGQVCAGTEWAGAPATSPRPACKGRATGQAENCRWNCQQGRLPRARNPFPRAGLQSLHAGRSWPHSAPAGQPCTAAPRSSQENEPSAILDAPFLSLIPAKPPSPSKPRAPECFPCPGRCAAAPAPWRG